MKTIPSPGSAFSENVKIPARTGRKRLLRGRRCGTAPERNRLILFAAERGLSQAGVPRPRSRATGSVKSPAAADNRSLQPAFRTGSSVFGSAAGWPSPR